MASAQVKPSSRRQEVAEAGRRKLEQFRKQKAAERAKKASQSSNTEPADNSKPSVSDSDGPLRQSADTHQVSSNETYTKSSISGDVYNLSFSNIAPNHGSKEKESVGELDMSSRLELIGPWKALAVNNRSEVVPSSNIDKQPSENLNCVSSSRESDGVPKDSYPYSGSTLLPTYLQEYTKNSLQPTTRMAGSTDEVAKDQHGSSGVRDFSINITSSSLFNAAKNEATIKRARPSFLDSLNISRTSETQYQQPEIEADLGTSSLQYISGNRESSGPSLTSEASDSHIPFEKFRNSLFPAAANGVMSGSTDFSMPKQNDDFTALEQHIEDLTQEKYSLQRDLDASRALAESLASENSSMTDTYNQQRSIVNQLKDDMEKLQQQIQAQMGELESVRIEYANAQLECNAADERSQILASEVISLEDKALRLRSKELKLERELGNAQAEMSSYKKKLQSVEKDRQDLQSTIKALQEEKKVLQTMVQKASSGGKSTNLGKSLTSRKNASTSTEDLDQEIDSIAVLGSDSSIIPEVGQLTLERFSSSVPADQMRVIHNINTLIAELTIEREELVQALSSELSQSAHVQELNKELSRKLEAQTQRLELLTAQKMAVDNISPIKQPDSHVEERAPIADEGDEVVERVLGWIMKMFPGGPSKRRTSKLI